MIKNKIFFSLIKNAFVTKHISIDIILSFSFYHFLVPKHKSQI
jgi:hypothetical protein